MRFLPYLLFIFKSVSVINKNLGINRPKRFEIILRYSQLTSTFHVILHAREEALKCILSYHTTWW